MSDFEKLAALLTEFGVAYSVQVSSATNARYIQCDAQTEKVAGYRGFTTDFMFDNNGKFIEMDIYE